MRSSPFVIGTRGSDLAMAQAREVLRSFRVLHSGLDCQIQVVATTGDKRLDLDLSDPSGSAGGEKIPRGLFTRELEVALLSGSIDLAVHSLKDLPTTLPAGLKLAATLRREAVEDMLICRHGARIADIPPAGVVATGSIRRRLQLLAHRPDLQLEGLRGNLPTRLEKLADTPGWSAIVLACAGLRRLGILHARSKSLRTGKQSFRVFTAKDVFWPAPGQGAIGLQCRTDDKRALDLARAAGHAATWWETLAERELLSALGGVCQTPLGVRSCWTRGKVHLRARLYRAGCGSPTEASAVLDPADLAAPASTMAEVLRAGVPL